MVFGFLIGRLLFTTGLGRAIVMALLTFATIGVTFSLAGNVLANVHYHGSLAYAYSVLALVGAALLAKWAMDWLSAPHGGIFSGMPFVLAVITTAIAWYMAFHLPFGGHQSVVMNDAVIALQGVAALVGVWVFAIGVLWAVNFAARQIAMEYLFDRYVRWYSEHGQRGL